MGMDIGFSKQAVMSAGITFFTDTNGTTEQIAQAIAEDDTSYANWLQEEIILMPVPYTDHNVVISQHGDNLSCRANPWGSTYHSLILFFTENEIKWSEF